MKEIIQSEYKRIKVILDSDKELKTIVYIGVGALTIYLLSKNFKTVTNVALGLFILTTATK